VDPLTLSVAIRHAHEAGLTAVLLTGIHRHTEDSLLALTTADPDSHLCLLNGFGWNRRVTPLNRRSQSGPERWDYRMSRLVWRDRYVLRIGDGVRYRDVPLHPAMSPLTRAHGWTDELEPYLVEPLVGYHDFRRAVEDLLDREEADARSGPGLRGYARKLNA